MTSDLLDYLRELNVGITEIFVEEDEANYWWDQYDLFDDEW